MQISSYLLAAMTLATPIISARAADPAPARKLYKVAIVNLAWDTARAATVEAGIKQELVQKGVLAESLRTLTLAEPKPETVAELFKLIKGEDYDSVMCIGVRKTMRVMAADRASDFPTLESCLSTFLTGNYPSGVSLKSEPFIVESHPTQSGEAGADLGAQRTPIAANSGAAPVTYYKRTIRIFDVPQKTLIWEKPMFVKISPDQKEAAQTKVIVRETLKVLEQSGLLP